MMHTDITTLDIGVRHPAWKFTADLENGPDDMHPQDYYWYILGQKKLELAATPTGMHARGSSQLLCSVLSSHLW
jgi:hypothetical protein